MERSDFKAMTEIGYNEGVIKKGESKIIQNLLKFNQILVKDIMTPRTVACTEDEECTITEFYKKKECLHFTRIPIFHNSIMRSPGLF